MRGGDLVHALSREWVAINRGVFGGALLAPPAIELDERLLRTVGEWNAGTRTIRFSLTFVFERPWWVVTEVLKHEMAHQYVSDVLGVEEEETAHGPAFQMVCDRYGIDARAGRAPNEEELHVVEKARKLLALSVNANKHEAENALAAAQRLLGQHGLAEEDIREMESGDLGVMALGEIIPKHELHHVQATMLLAGHFRVQCIWVPRSDPRSGAVGMQLEVVGARADIAMAEYVYAWLHQTAVRLCPERLPKRERIDFLAGVISGHMKRLDADAARATAQAAGRSLALVKIGDHDADVEAYFDRRYPETRTSRAGSRRRLSSAFFEGQAQGRDLAMSKPLAGGGPKLLGR
jgi:hypothetical protein